MGEWRGDIHITNEEKPGIECEVRFEGKQLRFRNFALIGFSAEQEPVCITFASTAEVYYAIEALQSLYSFGMSQLPLDQQLEVIAEISEDAVGRKKLVPMEDPPNEDEDDEPSYDEDEEEY